MLGGERQHVNRHCQVGDLVLPQPSVGGQPVTRLRANSLSPISRDAVLSTDVTRADRNDSF